jgi:uncharacterized membrane protein YdjX (TVP38/TMEM64 family)
LLQDFESWIKIKLESDLANPVGEHDPSFSFRRWLPLAVIVCLMILVYATGLHKQLTLQNIAENRENLRNFIEHHWVKAVLIYAAIYALAVAVSFPAAGLLTVAGGLLFGWVTGAITTIFAATVGATVIFLAAKTSLEKVLIRKSGPLLTKVRDGFAENAFSYLLFLRFVPLFPFWLVNLASALARIPLKSFVSATFLGIIPITLVFSFLGSSLDAVIEDHRAAYQACMAQGATNCTFDLAISHIVTPRMLVALASLGLVALIPVIVKKLKGTP